jgi:hypothetical protein
MRLTLPPRAERFTAPAGNIDECSLVDEDAAADIFVDLMAAVALCVQKNAWRGVERHTAAARVRLPQHLIGQGAKVVCPQPPGRQFAVDGDVERTELGIFLYKYGTAQVILPALIKSDRLQIDAAPGCRDLAVDRDGAIRNGLKGAARREVHRGALLDVDLAAGGQRQIAQAHGRQRIGVEHDRVDTVCRQIGIRIARRNDELAVLDRYRLAIGEIRGKRVVIRLVDDLDVAAAVHDTAVLSVVCQRLDEQEAAVGELRRRALQQPAIAVHVGLQRSQLGVCQLSWSWKRMRVNRTVENDDGRLERQGARVAALRVLGFVLRRKEQRIGEILYNAPARLNRGKTVVDADVRVIGIGGADVDDISGHIDEFGRPHPSGLIGHPTAIQIDDRAGLDRDVARKVLIPAFRKAVGAQRDVSAPCHQLLDGDSDLLGVTARGNQRRTDPGYAVGADARKARIDVHGSAVQESVFVGVGIVLQIVSGDRTNGDAVERGGHDDIRQSGDIDHRAGVDEDARQAVATLVRARNRIRAGIDADRHVAARRIDHGVSLHFDERGVPADGDFRRLEIRQRNGIARNDLAGGIRHDRYGAASPELYVCSVELDEAVA